MRDKIPKGLNGFCRGDLLKIGGEPKAASGNKPSLWSLISLNKKAVLLMNIGGAAFFW